MRGRVGQRRTQRCRCRHAAHASPGGLREPAGGLREPAGILRALLACALPLVLAAGCAHRGPAPIPVAAEQITPDRFPHGWSPTRADAGTAIATAAAARVGVPYRYGGTTERGYDCSGLVYRVYLEHGIQIPRTVRDQVRIGAAVARPRPGDLVFFRTGGRNVAHVGIYLGDGRFVHASSGRQRVVTDNLNHNRYFARHYAGARRLLPLRVVGGARAAR